MKALLPCARRRAYRRCVAWHRGLRPLVVRPTQVVGVVDVVDVGEVYRAKEAEFTQMLTKRRHRGRPRTGARMARATSAPARGLEELPRECGCLVVLKSAVAGRRRTAAI